MLEQVHYVSTRGEPMPETYIPPFTMTDEITNLVIEIAELTVAMAVSEQLSKNKWRNGNILLAIDAFLEIKQHERRRCL